MDVDVIYVLIDPYNIVFIICISFRIYIFYLYT